MCRYIYMYVYIYIYKTIYDRYSGPVKKRYPSERRDDQGRAGGRPVGRASGRVGEQAGGRALAGHPSSIIYE